MPLEIRWFGWKNKWTCIVQILILTPLHLAVDDGPLIQPSTYQYKSAKLNHHSASEVCRGPHSGVAAVSVPLVNNRKGSLLPPSEPSALRPSFMGSGDLVQVGRLPGVAEEASRLQRARSLPVKYRYHPSHSNNATLSHRHCKGHLPPPPFGVFGRPELNNSTTKACACQAGVVACVAFLTNDPVCAAVSCETLNIEQAEQDVKGQCVGASLSTGSPPYFDIFHYGVTFRHASSPWNPVFICRGAWSSRLMKALLVSLCKKKKTLLTAWTIIKRYSSVFLLTRNNLFPP